MKFIDLFGGIGGFRRGLELCGHKCVGFCELDKFAIASYTSMHLITEEQRQYLETLTLRKKQNEILKEKYRNGEWFANDIRELCAEEIPESDCWCLGFPCQDISACNNGNRLGLTGERSALFFRVMQLLEQTNEEKRPSYLFIENVKTLLSVNNGWDFAKLLIAMDNVGYDAEWQVLNSKDFYVPQNRERCFIIGHFRGRCTTEIFPIEGTGGKNSIHVIGHRKGYRRNTQIFSPDGITEVLSTCQGGGREHYTIEVIDSYGDNSAVYAVWYPKKDCYVAIRKLTPKEVFRLQGWSDDYFEKAQFVNSDKQLFKQAGNGVTVNVVQAIGSKMKIDCEVYRDD